MSTSTADQLRQIIDRLRKERQHHQDSMVEIDRAFKELGLELSPKRSSAPSQAKKPQPRSAQLSKKSTRKTSTRVAKAAHRKPGPKPAAAKGKRRKFPTTAAEFVLEFVRSKGGATTAEINKHWQKSGRGGGADNTLTELTKAGTLQRQQLEGRRGSRYSAAKAAGPENHAAA